MVYLECPYELRGSDRKRFFLKNCEYLPQSWWEQGAKAPKKVKLQPICFDPREI
jgi:hypothetical protein